MGASKEISVIAGGGHKGLVKFQNSENKNNTVKGSCCLDFRPSDAKLYLIGENIAEIDLNDINTAFEVPFIAKNVYGCMVRSRTVTMFGGNMPKNDMIKRIDESAEARARDIEKNQMFRNGKDATQTQNNMKTDERGNDKTNAQVLSESSETKITESHDEGITVDAVEVADSADSKPRRAVSGMKELEDWVKYDGNNFYYAVKPQIDEMFVCYPQDNELNNTVQNSKWVRVEAEDGYYVVGLLFNDNEPSYICYGVPAAVGTHPPEELENMCVWLPIDETSGYWMIYQSAINGAIVR